MKKLLFPIIAILVITACNRTDSKMDDNNDKSLKLKVEQDYQYLQAILDEKKANFEMNAPDEKKRIYKEGIDAVTNSGVLQNALQVGDTAIDFSLTNANGNKVNLKQYLDKGPVILLWYRGGWCPYCNLTLHRMQEELPNFKNLGANLIALTPELPDSSISTSEKNDLQFEVLSDLGNTIAKEYGVVFELTPEVAESYQNGFDLHAYNGDDSNELPLAATYIIDQNGIIQYAFLDADYRNRAEPKVILENLEKLN